MKRRFTFFLSIVFSFIVLVLINSCKKTTSETSQPQNPEILFDYRDGDAMGYTIGGKWNKTNLTWYVEKWGTSLSQTDTKDIMKKAFKVWSDVSTLTFTEVTNILNSASKKRTRSQNP